MHLHSTRQNCFSFGRHPPFSCVATLTTLVASPCRRQSGQEGQCAPQDYTTVWRSGEDDHDHHHHHPGTTELLSISMLKARYGAQKIWASFLEILCATWGGEVKSTYLAQGCTQLLSGGIFPWKGEDREVLPFFWPLGLQKLQEILNKINLWRQGSCTWDFKLM